MKKDINKKKYGLIGGLAMVVVMSLLSITGDHTIGVIKYVKYLPLFIVLYIASTQLKKYVEEKRFFESSLKSGITISAIAGICVAIGVIFLYSLNPEFAPLKFNMNPESWGTALLISAMLLIETFVIGFIFNFIVIQGLKPGAKAVNQ